MNTVNFINSLSSSDTVFYVLMILLTLISVILFYLIYNQNKEMSQKIKDRSLFEDEVINNEVKTSTGVKEVENLDTENVTQKIEEDIEIPDIKEMTQSINIKEIEDLQSITRELEMLPRERKIEMTPFEAEQEETAIISYDELLRHSDEFQNNKYDDEVIFEKTEISKADDIISSFVEEKIEMPALVELPKETEITNTDLTNEYEHEDMFLSSLKSLMNGLRD